MVDIFNVAKIKTEALSPGQTPEMRLSETVDPAILAATNTKPSSNSQRALFEKACPYYHSRSWGNYLPLMNVAIILSDDVAERSRLGTEVGFANLVQKAGEAGMSGNHQREQELWQQAAQIFPGRNWVRMQAALAALANDDVKNALVQVANMPPGPDPAIETRAKALWAELAKSFPEEAAMARTMATEPGDVEQAECMQVGRK